MTDGPKHQYSLAALLDIGLNIRQRDFEDVLKISAAPVDANELEQRSSRVQRRQAKAEKRRDERHERHEKEKLNRDSGNSDDRIIIRLSEETLEPSPLQDMAIEQQLVAQEFAVQQLVAATAASASLAATAAMAMSSITPRPSATEVTSKKKVKVSLVENLSQPPAFGFDAFHQAHEHAPPLGQNVGGFQTVMLRNIPNKYTRAQLLKRLDLHFKGEFDFLYVPIDYNNKCNVGYAFLNFKRPESVPRFLEHFNGVNSSVCLPDYNSSKICEVTPAHVQGLEMTIEHLRSSPMAEQLRLKPDWQPLLFDAKGEAMPFPLNPNKQRASAVKKLDDISDEDSRHIERESFPKKEKRRKEKNKRTPKSVQGRNLETCLIDYDIHTTAMVRYIPEELTRSMLNSRLAELFPSGSYDFLYMPIDFEKNNNVGYFFINFRYEKCLKQCVEVFHNKVANTVFDSTCEDYIEVSPARVQGLEMNISNLKNSSVGAIGQSKLEWKPLLFTEDGKSEELDLAAPQAEPQRDSSSSRRKKKKDSGGDKSKTLTLYSSLALPPKISSWSSSANTVQTDYENFKTVMLRHLPNKYTRPMLQEQLHKLGFAGTYDLLYLPIDAKNKCNIGYAFINFRTNDGVKECFKAFQGIECAVCLPGFNSNKIVEVTPARVQGLEPNVRHMQNSAMVEQLKPDWMPLVLDENDQPIDYPWKELTTTKLNALADPFMPSEEGAPFLNLNDNVPPVINVDPFASTFDPLANTRWMMAMEYMYRASQTQLWDTNVVNPAIHSTVMIRNIPNKFTRDKLCAKLKESLPENCIDFFYIPIDLNNKCNMGYCFVNFCTVEGIQKCVEKYHNIKSYVCLPGFNSSKVCVVTPARIQGLQENISHLANESLVFQTLISRNLGDWLPLLFDAKGNEIPFPRPDDDIDAATSLKVKKSVTSGSTADTRLSEDLYGQVLEYVDPASGGYTTVMVRNLPPDVRRDQLIGVLESAGLKGEFDFVYLPKDVGKEAHVGYVFVNLRSQVAVERAVKHFNHRVLEQFSNSKPLEVTPARVQGLDANIRHLSSVVALEDLEEGEWTPCVFDENGNRDHLPLPRRTSTLRGDAPEFLPQQAAVS